MLLALGEVFVEDSAGSMLRPEPLEVELVLYLRLLEWRGEKGRRGFTLLKAPQRLFVSEGGESWGEWLRE